MLRVTITHPKLDDREFFHKQGALEFGRGPGAKGKARCRIQDKYVSKDHVRARELPGGRVELSNLSRTNQVGLHDAETLAVGESRELKLPLRFTVGETTVNMALEEDPRTGVSREIPGLTLKTIQRSTGVGQARTKSEPFLNLRGSLTPERLISWFETVVAVQQAAAGSPEFYGQTARALVDLVGLDRGLVLLREGDEWTVAARDGAEASGKEYSRGVLHSVLEKKKTTYRTFDESSETGSHHWVDEIVASPILGAEDEVVGALYGARDVSRAKLGTGLGPMEAQVVQVLAAVAATGLARLQQEAEATRSRVQFEQFFTPELASRLEHDPDLLEAHEREISVLFADVRGFSRLSERLNARETYRLMGDVMERITGRIQEHVGVVVDYTGDGLFAMWNAPADQPHHAELACRAALEITAEMPAVNEEWEATLGGKLGIGVGVNTGRALVGNTGTRYKFKYGPRGHTVNVGSRVEGATKHLGVAILVTRATREALGPSFGTRRLCQARVVGIAGALDLHELHAENPGEAWCLRRDAYEAALSVYEEGRFAEACRKIYPLLSTHEGQEDIPCLTLIARAVERLKNPQPAFDPVLELTSK
jgi:adenylate cyclase